MDTALSLNDEFFNEEYDQSETIICSESIDRKETIVDRLKQITSVSEVLRIFGACAVLASMSLFLLNGWSEGNDIQRYLKLLAQTGLLTGAGLALSFCLKENKGARLFLGLGLISVVANFTILGALIFSMIQLDGKLVDYPSMVTWKAIGATAFWPVFVGAVAVLALLSRFCFGIFARNIAGTLSLSFLSLSTLLLIPVRSSLAISVIAIFALWLAATLFKKLSENENVVLTNETKFALGLLFLPGLLIIARSLSLYSIDTMMFVTLSGLAYFALRSWLSAFKDTSSLQSGLEIVQFFIGIFFSLQLIQLFPSAIDDIAGIVFSISVIALSVDQIKRAGTLIWQKSILNLTTIGLVMANLGIAFFSTSLFDQVSSLVICAGLLFIANNQTLINDHNRFSKVAALVGIIGCLLILASNIVALINLGNWMIVGLLGAALIIGGSLYERYGLSFTSTNHL